MSLSFDPTKASMVLLAHAGWQNVTVGSLVLDTLELIPETPTSESEDYGFAYISDSGTRVTGRVSALLAMSQATR